MSDDKLESVDKTKQSLSRSTAQKVSADGGGVDGRGLGELVGRGLVRWCVFIGRYTYIHIHIWWGWVVGEAGGAATSVFTH